MADLPFWRTKSLADMSVSEWESLCDGCAKCCLIKLEDPDSGKIEYTDVACHMLDLGSCRCSDYPNRQRHVPDCVVLAPGNVASLSWMPSTCAYRLLSEGADLPSWHPLLSGEESSVRRAGISAHGRVISESEVADAELEDHLVTWPE